MLTGTKLQEPSKDNHILTHQRTWAATVGYLFFFLAEKGGVLDDHMLFYDVLGSGFAFIVETKYCKYSRTRNTYNTQLRSENCTEYYKL